MGCFSGHLMSSASDQKLFCEICSAFNCSFNEFVGEKVVSPSYSSAILAPPPIIFFFKLKYSCVTMLCYFHVYSKVILFTHTHRDIFRFFSLIGHYKVLSIVPCAI